MSKLSKSYKPLESYESIKKTTPRTFTGVVLFYFISHFKNSSALKFEIQNPISRGGEGGILYFIQSSTHKLGCNVALHPSIISLFFHLYFFQLNNELKKTASAMLSIAEPFPTKTHF